MNLSRACCSLILAACFVGTSLCIADARLLNFDSPVRVPGRFVVTFKSPSDLRHLREELTHPGAHTPKAVALPDTQPTTTKACKALAHALAKAVDGTVTEILPPDGTGRRGFQLQAQDGRIAALAADPRIDTIEPVMRAETNATHTN